MRTPTISRFPSPPSYCVATADLRATPVDLHHLLLEEAELHRQVAEVASQCRWFETSPAYHHAVATGIEELACRVRALPCRNPAAARRLHDELAHDGGRDVGRAEPAVATARRVTAVAIREYLLERRPARAVAERASSDRASSDRASADRAAAYTIHREPDGARTSSA